MKIRYIIFSAFFLSNIYSSVIAQTQSSPEWNNAKIMQQMQQLNTLGSVLYLAAHPDDENTRLIAYLENGKHYRTGYLSLTRGDGGQNLIGIEQGPALGLLRTQELLAARKVDGAEQFFTRANDFGYVKNPKSTFKIWNKDSILSDVVLTIRKFKPDIIILRFPTTGEGGHGHHTASALLGLEAFNAAANPNRFSWQLKLSGIDVWQASRIYWNTFKFGDVNTTSPKQIQIDVGGYSPLLGKSYGEISAESRSMHKSQGFGTKRHRGSQIEYFKLLNGKEIENTTSNLMAGINTTWNRISHTKNIENQIQQLITNYQPLYPQKSVPQLLKIYQSIQEMDTSTVTSKYWKTQKLKEVKQLIVTCSGLWMEAISNTYSIIPGQVFTIQANIISRNIANLQVNAIYYQSQSIASSNHKLPKNEIQSYKTAVSLPSNTKYSSPYWLRLPHTSAMYQVQNPNLIGHPINPPAITIDFNLSINDVHFTITRPLIYKSVDPVRGEVYHPLEILPPLTINLSNSVFVFNDTIPKRISFTVKSNIDDIKGTLNIQLPDGWKIKILQPNIKLYNKGDIKEIHALLSPSLKAKDGKLSASIVVDGKPYQKSITRIEYNHIPSQFFLKDATAKVIHLDLKKAGGNKIGYIPGAGDKVPAALQQIGYDVTILTNDLLKKEDLHQFSAIVTGIRAYNINLKLADYYDKLMQYIYDGGNLIVQYNTNSRLGPIKQKIGPYTFTISRNRVTDEKAHVKFINPESSIVNFPNTITAIDFDNWIQERGTYFAVDLDQHYQTVFEMHDQGEKPHKGSLIYAKYGRGYFVYTGLVFFRELPAGIPGAYRLFENILSLGDK